MNGRAQPASVSILRASGHAADRGLLREIENLIAPCEDLYPGIDLWLRRTALPGILAGARSGFLACSGSVGVAAAIVKFSGELKLCSLRVLPGHEHRGIGTSLFAAAASTLAEHGDSVFFTAPEALAIERKRFFEQLGFRLRGRFGETYRRGQAEMVFRGEAADVARRASRLAQPTLLGWEGKCPEPAILMSVRPKYANAILAGRKTIELRRQFSRHHVGATVFIYSSSPEQRIVGTARIGGVREIDVAEVRETLMDLVQCTRQELKDYADNRGKLFAIELSDVAPLAVPLDRKLLEQEFGGPLRPPVSYQRLGDRSRWSGLRDRLGM